METLKKFRVWRYFVPCFIVFLLLFPLSCSKCQGDLPQKTTKKPSASENINEILFVSDSGILRYLAPTIENFRIQNPEIKVSIKAAHPNQMLSVGQKADLLLVPGFDLLSSLKASLNLSDNTDKYVYRKLKILSNKDLLLIVERPVHLLQPALDKIAMAPENTPLGDLSRKIIESWGLKEKLQHKFHQVKDQNTARRFIRDNKIQLAFVFDKPEKSNSLYKTVLENSLSAKRFIHFYFATPNNTNKMANIEKFTKYLKTAPIMMRLQKIGFYDEAKFQQENFNIPTPRKKETEVEKSLNKKEIEAIEKTPSKNNK